MLNPEKNAFHDAVTQSGVERGMFRFESASSESFNITKNFQSEGLRIQLEGSDLWFVAFKMKHDAGDKRPLFACKSTHYDYVAEKYVTDDWTYSATSTIRNDDRSFGVPTLTLAVSCSSLQKWIKKNIPKFLEHKSIPDLWQMANTGTAITSLASGDDSPFSKSERVQLTQAVAKLQEFVLTTFDHNEQQKRLVAQRFDALTAALDNQGRTTWFTLLLGTLASVGSTLYLSNEQGRLLLRVARELIENAVHFLG